MTSAHPDHIPVTIPAALDAAALAFGDREALVDGDLRISFTELRTRGHHAAAALIASGIRRGDRVALWAPNMSEWVIAALGIYCAGGAIVPLNTRYKGGEAADILARSGARLLFSVTDFLDTNYVELLGDQRPDSLEEIVVLRGDAGNDTPWAGFLSRSDDSTERLDARMASLGPDDLSDILFTSGTTGAPKGAMLRHGACTRAYTAWSDVVGLAEGDRYLIVNPFFHAFGLKAGILASILKGATILPHAVFDVPSVMQRVEEEQITMLPGPPAIHQTILDHPRLAEFDLSSLRLSVTGAATVPVEMIRRMSSELGYQTVVTGYGLTEATGIATMCRHDDDPETIANTAGRAIPDVEVRIVDGDGTELPRGEPGEVVIRGYNVMSGYFEQPGETAEAIDADGWLHTGDVGVMDADGNVKITDRTKDMFIVGGFNAYPAEIEKIMMNHPSISQVAVVGVPDDRLGEVGRAFVVPRPDEDIDADELIAWCRENMANFKVPRSIELRTELPLNASGKVLKYALRAGDDEAGS